MTDVRKLLVVVLLLGCSATERDMEGASNGADTLGARTTCATRTDSGEWAGPLYDALQTTRRVVLASINNWASYASCVDTELRTPPLSTQFTATEQCVAFIADRNLQVSAARVSRSAPLLARFTMQSDGSYLRTETNPLSASPTAVDHDDNALVVVCGQASTTVTVSAR